MTFDTAMLDLFPAGYIVVDDDFTLLSVNSYVVDALQLQREYVGLSLREYLTKASNILIETYITPILVAEGHVEQTQMTFVTSAGERVPMVVNIRQVANNYYLTVFKCGKRDALIKELTSTKKILQTSNAKLENAVKEQKESQLRLVERSARQAEIFAVIGHELRTPLAALQMMASDMYLSSIQPHGADMEASINSLLSILDDMRVIVSPDQAKKLSNVLDAPSLVIERVIRTLASVTKEHDLNVHFYANKLAQHKVIFKAQALQQLITNLLKNAAIHSHASDVWVDLKGKQQANNIQLSLTVQDNGVGISLSKKQRLYEAFVRGDSDANGTGLGLYIVKELAEQLEGELSYFDSPSGGAGFKMKFAVPYENDIQTKETLPEQSLQGVSVLLAEDQVTIQMLSCKQLQLAGCEVVGVCDGRQALETLATRAFDIVLTDINMPNINGFELTQTLRDQGYQGTIIGVTAATLGEDTDKLLTCGADAVIAKPLIIKSLRQTLHKLSS